MKKKLKLMLAVVLSLAMVMGSSLTALSATVVMRNPNTAGVQLIGDTLLIQEDHHNFFVLGKSVMIQCPGVTDILPNNVTNMVDIQFNGNLYKGIREVLIVSAPGKDDKVRLEEGSMIITGITTPEQVQNVKAAIVSQPNTLAALKTALTGASKDLSATKNYIVGKHNAVQNEAGLRVSKKEIQGTVDIVADQEVAQAVVEEAKSSASESKPAEEKKDPTPTPSPTSTPTPTPTPTCDHSSGYACYSQTTHKCRTCKNEFDHVFTSNDETHSCTLCNEQDIPHTYSNGVCSICNHSCTHGGATSGTCEYCGKTLGTPTGCQVDHSQYCIGWTCECGEKGTEAHLLMDDGTGRKHHCLCCDLCTADHTWDDGVCTVCIYYCDHNGKATGTCDICGKALSTTICAHTSGYDLISETQHECRYCHEKFSHEWDNGWCTKCGQPCPTCSGNGKPGAACETCGKTGSPVSCPNEANHASLHIGKKCPNCEYIGEAPHTYVANNDITHKCSSCGGDTSTPHNYVLGVCTECEHICAHDGASSGECSLCHQTIGACQVNHSTMCPGQECTCGEHGTGEHQWNIFGMCTLCSHSCSHPEGYTNKDEDYHECPICKVYESHNWYDGKCRWCDTPCTACYGEGMDLEDGCYQCGKKNNPAGCPNEANHASLHVGQKCPSCEVTGSVAHTWNSETGKCSVCEAECTKYNKHADYCIGRTCSICGYVGTKPHTYQAITPADSEKHVCNTCSTFFDHEWEDGKCKVCNQPCTTCSGYGELGGCPRCGKVEEPFVCSVDHSTFCQGTQCPECYEYGDGDCNWEYVDAYTHKCSYCHGTDSHNWGEGYCLDCDGECPNCHGAGASGGCEICEYE